MYPQQEIIKNILETFDQSAIVQFREFLAKQPNVTKWMIASDYCLHDSDRPQDVMSFAIIPYDDWFDKIKKEIGAAIPCDIKKARDIGNPAITYFRKQTIFHVSFILSKDGTLLTNGPGSNKLAIARESIKITIEHLVEMDRDQADIRKLRALALDAQSNGFNTKLFSDVLLLSVLFPFITLIIARERSVEIVGWFSDRDSMTKWHDGVVWTFAYENTRGIGGFLGIDIDSAKITVALPDMSSGKEEMWYDNFIRIADYFAGAIAAWDTVANGVKHKKHARMLRDVIADAPNVVIMKLTIGHYGMQCARLDVEKISPTISLNIGTNKIRVSRHRVVQIADRVFRWPLARRLLYLKTAKERILDIAKTRTLDRTSKALRHNASIIIALGERHIKL